MKKNELKQQVSAAIAACQEKKAEDISILELEKDSGAFTDYFVVCSGTNPRQIQAISDEVEDRLKKAGLRPAHVEGYKQAEWVLTMSNSLSTSSPRRPVNIMIWSVCGSRRKSCAPLNSWPPLTSGKSA
jgi:ribosome silencing factor RsfS/YbeB/iojap